MIRLTEHLILFTSAVTAGVAAILFVYAWRGRRTDDHPICRKCRFDLFGLPETSTQCPECGTDLSRPRAVRIGNREVRRGPRTTALLLGCLAAPVWILAAVVWFRGVDTIRYHPVWMLRNNARSADASVSDRAYTELLRRVRAGRLAAGDLAPIVNETLDLQADANKNWRPLMGDLVEQAWLADLAGDEQWARYVRQVLETWIDFRFRDRISRDGQMLGHEFVALASPRAGSTKRLTPRMDIQVDVDWPNKSRSRASFTPGNQFRTSSYGTMPAEFRTMALGPHTARATVKAHVTAAGAPPARTADVEFHVDRTWTLVEGPSAEPINDPSLEEAIRRCVRVGAANRFQRGVPEITITSPPCPVAWDIAITAPGASAPTTRRRFESLSRRISCDTGETANLVIPFISRDVPDDAEAVTVTLTPSATAAELTTRLNSYWNGTLVFKDVPIPKRSAAATSRATTRPAR
jgi:hypothetical protein